MSDFQGSFLRVLKPRTTNGTNLKYDSKGKIMYKETHAPITAEKYFKNINAKLPQHLRMVLERVGDPVDTGKGHSFKPQRAPRVNPQPGQTPTPVASKKTPVKEEL